MRVARQNREELSVAAELRQQQTSPFCADFPPTGRVVSAKVTETSLRKSQSVSKELAGCWLIVFSNAFSLGVLELDIAVHQCRVTHLPLNLSRCIAGFAVRSSGGA